MQKARDIPNTFLLKPRLLLRYKIKQVHIVGTLHYLHPTQRQRQFHRMNCPHLPGNMSVDTAVSPLLKFADIKEPRSLLYNT